MLDVPHSYPSDPRLELDSYFVNSTINVSASSTTDTADYIIVGGGTFCLVVANRLSEDPNVNVVVLEAGENHLNNPQVNIRAFWTSLMETELDWQLRTPSKVCAEKNKFTSICILIFWWIAGSKKRCDQVAAGKASGRFK